MDKELQDLINEAKAIGSDQQFIDQLIEAYNQKKKDKPEPEVSAPEPEPISEEPTEPSEIPTESTEPPADKGLDLPLIPPSESVDEPIGGFGRQDIVGDDTRDLNRKAQRSISTEKVFSEISAVENKATDRDKFNEMQAQGLEPDLRLVGEVDPEGGGLTATVLEAIKDKTGEDVRNEYYTPEVLDYVNENYRAAMGIEEGDPIDRFSRLFLVIKDENGRAIYNPDAVQSLTIASDELGEWHKKRVEQLTEDAEKFGAGLRNTFAVIDAGLGLMEGINFLSDADGDNRRAFLRNMSNQASLNTQLAEIEFGKSYTELDDEQKQQIEDVKSKGITENFIEDDNYDAAAAMLWNTALQQIPQLAMMIFAPEAKVFQGLAGASKAASLTSKVLGSARATKLANYSLPLGSPLLGMSAAGSKYNQIYDNPHLTEGEKLFMAAETGVAELVLEALGGGTERRLAKAAAGFGKKATKEGVASALKSATSTQFKEALKGIPKGMLTEFGEESLAGINEVVLDKVFLDEGEFNIYEIVDQGVVGAAVGGGMSSTTALLKSISFIGSSINASKRAKLLRQMSKDRTLILSGSLEGGQIYAIRDRMESNRKKILALDGLDAKMYSRFSDDDIMETIKLNQEMSLVRDNVRLEKEKTSPSQETIDALEQRFLEAAMKRKEIEQKYDAGEANIATALEEVIGLDYGKQNRKALEELASKINEKDKERLDLEYYRDDSLYELERKLEESPDNEELKNKVQELRNKRDEIETETLELENQRKSLETKRQTLVRKLKQKADTIEYFKERKIKDDYDLDFLKSEVKDFKSLYEEYQQLKPIDEVTPTITEEATPTTEEAAPVEEETAPVTEEAAPVTEETAPVAEETAPVTEETTEVEEAAPVVEEETEGKVEEEAEEKAPPERPREREARQQKTKRSNLRRLGGGQRLLSRIDSAERFIKSITKGKGKVVILSDRAFNKKRGKKGASKAFVNFKENTVYLNEKYLKQKDSKGQEQIAPDAEVTVFHEAAHLALGQYFGENVAAVKAAMQSVKSKILSTAGKRSTSAEDSAALQSLARRLDEFVSNYEESKRPDEYLAELAGIMAATELRLGRKGMRGVFDSFAAFIAKALRAMGFKNITTKGEVFNLMDDIASGLVSGNNRINFPNATFTSSREGTADRIIEDEITPDSEKFNRLMDFLSTKFNTTFKYDENQDEAVLYEYDSREFTINPNKVSPDSPVAIFSDFFIEEVRNSNKAFYTELMLELEKKEDYKKILGRFSDYAEPEMKALSYLLNLEAKNLIDEKSGLFKPIQKLAEEVGKIVTELFSKLIEIFPKEFLNVMNIKNINNRITNSRIKDLAYIMAFYSGDIVSVADESIADVLKAQRSNTTQESEVEKKYFEDEGGFFYDLGQAILDKLKGTYQQNDELKNFFNNVVLSEDFDKDLLSITEELTGVEWEMGKEQIEENYPYVAEILQLIEEGKSVSRITQGMNALPYEMELAKYFSETESIAGVSISEIKKRLDSSDKSNEITKKRIAGLLNGKKVEFRAQGERDVLETQFPMEFKFKYIGGVQYLVSDLYKVKITLNTKEYYGNQYKVFEVDFESNDYQFEDTPPQERRVLQVMSNVEKIVQTIGKNVRYDAITFKAAGQHKESMEDELNATRNEIETLKDSKTAIENDMFEEPEFSYKPSNFSDTGSIRYKNYDVGFVFDITSESGKQEAIEFIDGAIKILETKENSIKNGIERLEGEDDGVLRRRIYNKRSENIFKGYAVNQEDIVGNDDAQAKRVKLNIGHELLSQLDLGAGVMSEEMSDTLFKDVEDALNGDENAINQLQPLYLEMRSMLTSEEISLYSDNFLEEIENRFKGHLEGFNETIFIPKRMKNAYTLNENTLGYYNEKNTDESIDEQLSDRIGGLNPLDFQFSNALTRESLRTKISNILSSFTRKWLRQDEGLKRAKQQASDTKNRAMYNATVMIKDLNRLMKGMDEDVKGLVDEYFQALEKGDPQEIEDVKNKIEALDDGAELVNQMDEMRSFLDKMSSDIIGDEFYLNLSEDMIKTIFGNIGAYLRTSYKAYTDPDYTPSEKVRAEAIEATYQKMLKDALEQGKQVNEKKMRTEAENQVKKVLVEIKTRERSMLSGLNLQIPKSPFMRKKRTGEIEEYFQRLLGLETNTLQRFRLTAAALSSIKAAAIMDKILFENMGGDQILSKDSYRELPEAEQAKYIEIKDGKSILNGYYMTEELMKFFKGNGMKESTNIFGQVYAYLLSLLRETATIFNPVTIRKNWTGGLYTFVANGIVNPKAIRDMRNRVRRLVSGRADEDTEKLFDEMARMGIGSEDVSMNVIESAARAFDPDPDMRSLGIKQLNKFDELRQRARTRYAAIDTFTKMVIYRYLTRDSMPLRMFGKSWEELNENQKNKVKEAAAKRVLDNTPSYQKLPLFYSKVLVKLPFGDFLSFTYEALRSSMATLKNAMSDIAEGGVLLSKGETVRGGQTLKDGIFSAAGIVALTFYSKSIFEAAVYAPTKVMELFDDDDEEEVKKITKEDVQTIEEILIDDNGIKPDWMKNHLLSLAKISDDGKMTVYDISTEDPYAISYGILKDLMQNNQEGVAEKVMEVINQQRDPNMAVDLAVGLIQGEDAYGKKITDADTETFDKIMDYVGFTASRLAPSSPKRSFKILMNKDEEDKTFSELSGEAFGNLAIRTYDFNPATTMGYKLRDAVNEDNSDRFSELSPEKKKVRVARLTPFRESYQNIKQIARVLSKKDVRGGQAFLTDAINIIQSNRTLEASEKLYIFGGAMPDVDAPAEDATPTYKAERGIRRVIRQNDMTKFSEKMFEEAIKDVEFKSDLTPKELKSEKDKLKRYMYGVIELNKMGYDNFESVASFVNLYDNAETIDQKAEAFILNFGDVRDSKGKVDVDKVGRIQNAVTYFKGRKTRFKFEKGFGNAYEKKLEELYGLE